MFSGYEFCSWKFKFVPDEPKKVNQLSWVLGSSMGLSDLGWVCYFQISFQIWSYFSMCVFTVIIFPREVFSAFCSVPGLLLKFPLWYFRLLGGAQFNIFHPGIAALDEDPRKRVKLCIGLGVNWQLIGVEMLHEGFCFVAAKTFRNVLTLQAT